MYNTKKVPDSIFINYVNSRIEYHSYNELVELTGYTVQNIIDRLQRLNLELRTPLNLLYKLGELKANTFDSQADLARHFKVTRGTVSKLFKVHPELKTILKDK